MDRGVQVSDTEATPYQLAESLSWPLTAAVEAPQVTASSQHVSVEQDLYYTGRYNDFGCTALVLRVLVLSTAAMCVMSFVLSVVYTHESFVWFSVAYVSLLLLCGLLLICVWTYRRNIWSICGRNLLY